MSRVGTTSAHAENTGQLGGMAGANLNYLRVRGEYLNELGFCSMILKNGPIFALESRIYGRIMGQKFCH